ncbi:MAG: TonB-dependent receptor [Bacteroidetes bacterium]|nr:TonB-dependent receptor [Bacteroidota bacterium]
MTRPATKVLLPILLLFCSITHLLGQNELISGKVIDQETGFPIPGVHIIFPDHHMVTISDSIGQFKVTVPKSETLNLQVSHLGYTQEIFHYKTGSELKVSLKPSSTELNHTIQVTASKRQQATVTETRSLTLLSEKEIFSSASRTTPELLMNTAGIWLQKTNHGGGSPIIRGLTGNQIVLINDGIRMNNAIYRYGPNQYLSTIDPGTLNTIEVVRGTGSLLYGSDAIGGVIQLFSQSPEFNTTTKSFRFSGKASTRFLTSRMQTGGSIQLNGEGQRFAFSSNIAHDQFGDLVAGRGIGVQSPSGYRQFSGNIKTAFRLTDRDILYASHQNLIQNHVPRFDQVNLGGFSRYEFNPQSQSITYFRLQHTGKTRWTEKVTATVYFNALREGLTTEKSGSSIESTFTDLVQTTGANVEILSRPKRFWTTQTGVEFFKDVVSSRGKKRFLSTSITETTRGNYADGSTLGSMAVFSNHQLETNHFLVSGGARYTGSKIEIVDPAFGNQQFNPSALVCGGGITWKASKNLFPYISVQTGFRAPNIDDLSKFGTVEAGIFEIPANDLKPERSTGIESGIKFASKKSAFSLSGFQTNLSNIIERVPALYLGQTDYENRKVFKKENLGEAIFRGLEVQSELSILHHLKARGHFTYTYGENQTKEEPSRRIPPAFGQASLHYDLSRTINIAVFWNKAGKQSRLSSGDLADKRISSRLRDGAMPGWQTIDLVAGYTAGKLKTQLAIRNIFNEAYRMYGSGVDGYGRHASITIQWSI